MPSRVIRPESTKLLISQGDWLLVKTRLNYGESADALERMSRVQPDGTVRLSAFSWLAEITAYLLDWSLTDLNGTRLAIQGEPVETMESMLKALDPQTVEEILTAIRAHERAQAALHAEQKKILADASGSGTTSPSPSAVAGVSSGSAPLT